MQKNNTKDMFSQGISNVCTMLHSPIQSILTVKFNQFLILCACTHNPCDSKHAAVYNAFQNNLYTHLS